MTLDRLKLVTIVTEFVLKDILLEKAVNLGIRCHTYTEVDGFRHFTGRPIHFTESIKIELICTDEIADQIVAEVVGPYLNHYACIAWMVDIEATPSVLIGTV